MSYQVSHGLPETYRAAAADLYWQAFGGKLGPVMGPPARAQTYLRRVLRLDQCFAIVHDNRLLGIVGLHGESGTFAGGTARDFGAVYGRWRGLWRLGLLTRVGSKDPDIGALMIDGFSVHAAARGQGVGAALLKAVMDHARATGFEAVQLDVVGSNWRAREFYQRHGFTVQSQHNIGALRLIFGFDSTARMQRIL
jgi:ribosomal protein S18 acetylase RimI-like enzyme